MTQQHAYLLLALVACIFAQPTQFSAKVLLTYSGMTNAGTSGTLYYDEQNFRMAFVNTGATYTELYYYNNMYGYGPNATRYQLQKVYKISPTGSCSPCAQYGLSFGFPFLNRTSGGAWTTGGKAPPNVPSAIAGTFVGSGATSVGSVDSDNCRRYTVPSSINSWVAYYGLVASTPSKFGAVDNLCYVADTSGRLFTVTGGYSTSNSTFNAVFQSYASCKCLQPLDIVISLDRSGSISVPSTYFYRSFLAGFATSFYLNASDPVNTAQIAISQWSTTAYPLNYFGQLNFTEVASNVVTASSQLGCTSATASDCNFCYDHPNNTDQTCTNRKNAGQFTCTSCGIQAAKDLFVGPYKTYVNRTNAKRIFIMITDGVANTRIGISPPDDGVCAGGISVCINEIKAQRTALLNAVPGILTYAIGVPAIVNGQVTQVDTDTLNAISGDPSRTILENSFQSLVTNINNYILGFCQLPDPVAECGQCCGFCQCGSCTNPDTPLPNAINGTAFCAGYVVPSVPSAGHCYTEIFNGTPCSSSDSCKTPTCNASAAAGSRCGTTPVNCTVAPPPCYGPPVCKLGSCSSEFIGCPVVPTEAPTKAPTNAPTPAPTDAPTSAPTERPTRAPTAPLEVPVELTEEPTSAPTESPTQAPTGAPTAPPPCTDEDGYYCFANAVCCPDLVSCCCTNNYTGVLCGTPPDQDECTLDSQCFFGLCNNATCVNNSAGVRRCVDNGPKQCDNGLFCDFDYCDETDGLCKSQDTSAECNDNLQCTIDSCDVNTGCVYVQRNCSAVEDICNLAACNDFAATDAEVCVPQSIVCPIDDNCSIAYCSLNESGCVNQTYSCSFLFIGIIAGVTAGVIAGATVAAAFLVAAGMTAGAAAAVSTNYASNGDSNVRDNPLYTAETKTGTGLA